MERTNPPTATEGHARPFPAVSRVHENATRCLDDALVHLDAGRRDQACDLLSQGVALLHVLRRSLAGAEGAASVRVRLYERVARQLAVSASRL